QGGIGALSRAFANALKEPPLYGVRITGIDLKQKRVSLSNGKVVRFEKLVNTMPLVQLVAMLNDAPDEVRTAAKNLRATTVYYFDIGVRGEGGPASHYHWVYFPEPEFIFYRAGSYSAVHKEAAPAGCRSYYVEMSGELEGLLSQPEKLKQRVLVDLKKAGILTAQDEILFMELCEIPHAYVIFDQHYEESRNLIFDYLKQNDVLTGGRWGGWGYGGMEDAMLDGQKIAGEIMR
ncbi:MAG TPA: FAD-dependent oxidoreductase, partial [Verrucomicrobiae bacterium]|nr:FAD-dependent oxidoreductase [Verrucomicrobiae bacterium]